jgi:hypothetical protein
MKLDAGLKKRLVPDKNRTLSPISIIGKTVRFLSNGNIHP